MKRSEMIDIMLIELSKNRFKTREERRSTMEHILWEMEEAGMLPPHVCWEVDLSPFHKGIKMDGNVWEPESDDSNPSDVTKGQEDE